MCISIFPTAPPPGPDPLTFFFEQITVYAPACLIVGTKGKSSSSMQSFVTGSVSRYCLQNSPVPCIVVRPTRKRLAKRAKRLADEKRRNYANVVELSGARGSQMVLNPVEGLAEAAAGGPPTGASEKEAQAVAAAIGIPRSVSRLPGLRRPTPGPDDEGAPLSSRTRGASVGSVGRTESIGADSPSPTGAFVISEPNSPEFEPLDSPAVSDEDVEWDTAGTLEGAEETIDEGEEERRGRTMSQDVGPKRTGAKKFVFPKERRKSEGG